jgi:hypothetical protein
VSNYIKVTPLNLVREDERGASYTYGFEDRKNFVFITRKAGTVSGNTYHEGRSIGTNPKTFVILTGQLIFSYRHIDEEARRVIAITVPSIIELAPMVTHAVEAITDITILECNSLGEIENDRHPLMV